MPKHRSTVTYGGELDDVLALDDLIGRARDEAGTQGGGGGDSGDGQRAHHVD
jgi:hypothetical protein